MKLTLKSRFNLRFAPLAMAGVIAFSGLVAQPVNAQSVANTVRCAALTEFASASATTLKLGQQAMQATFDLTIKLKQLEWELADKATAALRQVSVSAFKATSTAFANIPGMNSVRKQAVKSYVSVLLNAVLVLETNIDAAEAAYREDMLALIRAHQAALTELVQTLVDKINAAAAKAKADCEKTGVVVTLVGTIAAANAELLSKTIVLDVQDLGKAVKIVVTRDSEFLKQDVQFVKTATDATIKLTRVILTGKAETF